MFVVLKESNSGNAGPLPQSGFHGSRVIMAVAIAVFCVLARCSVQDRGWTGVNIFLGLLWAGTLTFSICRESQENFSWWVGLGWWSEVILMVAFGYLIRDNPPWIIAANVSALLFMMSSIRRHYRYLPEKLEDPKPPRVDDPESW